MEIENEYYPNGELYLKKQKKNNIIDYVYYSKNGNLQETFSLKDDKIHGDRCYYKNEKIQSILPYKNGNIEGIGSIYYDNGKIKKEINFYNDLKNGIEKCSS